MRRRLLAAPWSKHGLRALTLATVAIALLIAWSPASFATEGTQWYVCSNGVVRSDLCPMETPTPSSRMPSPTPHGHGESSTTMMKGAAPPKSTYAAKKSVYSVSQSGNVYTISRHGKAWVILTQGKHSIVVTDPSGAQPVVDISLGADTPSAYSK